MMKSLLSKLPEVQGTYSEDDSMAFHTWFGVGGPADIIFCPADEKDLLKFLTMCPKDIPITPIGAGSNLLVRDGGIAGVVVKVSENVTTIYHEGTRVIAGAGATDAAVARYAQKAGIAGLEFLIGIPGTIGGGLRMNAGAYGSEFCDVVNKASALTRDGQIITATPPEMGMSYRNCDAPRDWIFVSAELQGRKGNPETIRARMKEIIHSRSHSQPKGVRTGGSTFANPCEGKAWEAIDKAGCRGLQIGGAKVSDKHCNFLINTGVATADDIETLGETIRQRVRQSGGPHLRWEIRRLGRKSSGGRSND